MNIATLSLPDPHPIYKCNFHLQEEYALAANTTAKYIGRLTELHKELDVRQLHNRHVFNPTSCEGKKEFVELMQTCKACRQQAILYGNYKAKNLPPLIEKE